MPKIKLLFEKYWNILKNAASGFGSDNAAKLSGSLAYGTIFSLPPMLLLVTIFGGYFYGPDAFSGKVFEELNQVLGSETALQIQNVIKGLNEQEDGLFAAIIGGVALIIGATGVFTEIQSSLNFIWGVRSKPKKGVIKLLLNRLLSFSMIIGLGFVLIVTLIINTLLVALSYQILRLLPNFPVELMSVVSFFVIFFVISFLFSIIFKMLPDVKIKWRQVWPGAFVTTILFLGGKYLINLYVSSNNTISLYGAASTVIILLVWIYFSSLILYFGAEFTKAYIEYHGKVILPSSFAEYDDKRSWRVMMEKKKQEEEENKRIEDELKEADA